MQASMLSGSEKRHDPREKTHTNNCSQQLSCFRTNSSHSSLETSELTFQIEVNVGVGFSESIFGVNFIGASVFFCDACDLHRQNIVGAVSLSDHFITTSVSDSSTALEPSDGWGWVGGQSHFENDATSGLADGRLGSKLGSAASLRVAH